MPGLKDKAKGALKNLGNNENFKNVSWKQVLNTPAKLLELGGKLVIIFVLFGLLNIAKDIFSSGLDGSFELIGRDDMGRVKIASFKAKKTLPEKTPEYMLSYNQDLLGMKRNISGGKRIYSLGHVHLFGTGGVTLSPDSVALTVGVTVIF